MMRKFVIALISLPFVVFSGSALAGDAAAGEAKAEICLDCHEPADFEGLGADDIAAAIQKKLSGEEKHPAAIQELDPADVPDVAAYFAAESGK